LLLAFSKLHQQKGGKLSYSSSEEEELLVATNKSVTRRGSKSTSNKSRPRIEVVLERPHK
jgi:hypothetical protein